MKFYQVLLLALCISLAFTCGEGSGDSKDKCNGKLSDGEKDQGMTHCCFVRYKAEKQNEVKGCKPINQYQFDHISNYVNKELFWGLGTEDYNIECSSSYFKLSLLSLILILL